MAYAGQVHTDLMRSASFQGQSQQCIAFSGCRSLGQRFPMSDRRLPALARLPLNAVSLLQPNGRVNDALSRQASLANSELSFPHVIQSGRGVRILGAYHQSGGVLIQPV